MRGLPLFLLLAVGMPLTACARSQSQASSASDSAAILQIYRDWPRAAEALDTVRYVAFLDDSITLLVPGAAPIRGIPAYTGLLRQFFQAAKYRVRLQAPSRLQVAGPWAFARYEGALTTFPRNRRDSSVARNRYLDILHRQSNGAWRVYIHSWQAITDTTR